MADVKVLAPFILSFEGGFVNHPNDRGGATNKGVTIATWKKYGRDLDNDGDIDVDDVKLISNEDATNILKSFYWDKAKADDIKSQSVANIIVDWVWGSGSRILKKVQEEANKLVKKPTGVDGIIGKDSLRVINEADPKELFQRLHDRRTKFFNDIVANNSSQQIYLKGWLRRLNSIEFECLTYNDGFHHTFNDKGKKGKKPATTFEEDLSVLGKPYPIKEGDNYIEINPVDNDGEVKGNLDGLTPEYYKLILESCGYFL